MHYWYANLDTPTFSQLLLSPDKIAEESFSSFFVHIIYGAVF